MPNFKVIGKYKHQPQKNKMPCECCQHKTKIMRFQENIDNVQDTMTSGQYLKIMNDLQLQYNNADSWCFCSKTKWGKEVEEFTHGGRKFYLDTSTSLVFYPENAKFVGRYSKHHNLIMRFDGTYILWSRK